MRFPVKYGVILLILIAMAGGVAMGWPRAWAYWKARNRPDFREAAVVRGDITSVVNSTGTVQPVLRVQVGSVVSGPVVALHVDFNDAVKTGDLLAEIDPRIYEAAKARDEASLATAKAEIERVNALLQQAINDHDRAVALRAKNKDYISATVMDRYTANCESLKAQLKVAEAAVKQAQANLQNSTANLDYTKICSPVDGTVIDRKIDRGQTLAAQFTTPELFVVAPDMEKMMLVFASVDEADIGLIREAQQRKEPVEFTVDAYPEGLFTGEVSEVRWNPTTEQNVVTYPVVVEAPNPDMKLMPGMTANISFRISEHKDVLKIPNAALRFYPKPEMVRPEDRKVLDGAETDTDENETEPERSATEIAEAGRNRKRRHVWIVEGEFLKAVEITTGLSDNRFTELVSGDLKKSQKLVTGIKPPKP